MDKFQAADLILEFFIDSERDDQSAEPGQRLSTHVLERMGLAQPNPMMDAALMVIAILLHELENETGHQLEILTSWRESLPELRRQEEDEDD
jgi:hypothetical protein